MTSSDEKQEFTLVFDDIPAVVSLPAKLQNYGKFIYIHFSYVERY